MLKCNLVYLLYTIPVLPHNMGTSCVSLQLGESLSNILPRSCISPCPHVPMHCAPPLNISQHISTYLEISHHISNILPTSFISLCPHVRVHSAPSLNVQGQFSFLPSPREMSIEILPADLNFFRETLMTLFIL